MKSAWILLVGSTVVATGSCVGDSTVTGDGGTDATQDQLTTDSGADVADVALDAADAGSCNLSEPFSTPALVPGVNVGQSIFGATFSADELTAYLGTHEIDGGSGFQIYVTTRPNTTAAFATPTLLAGGVNNAADDERFPFVSTDGLTLFVADDFQTYSATRASVQTTFGTLSSVPGVNTSSSSFFTEDAYTNADGSHLFVVSSRDTGTSQGGWIYEATLAGGGAYNTPTKITEIASPQYEGTPVSSGDALTLYFASGRDGMGQHVYVATRATLTMPFGNVTEVTEVNSAASNLDFPGWLSTDSCRLYVLSTRGTGALEVYVASKPTN